MITLQGSAQRTYVFPADRQAVFAYYADLNRVLPLLDYVSIAEQLAERHYRLAYQATELGLYKVCLICDVKASLDVEHHTIRVRPLESRSPVQPKVGTHSLEAMAYYSSDSVFRDLGERTRVEYRLALKAFIPKPFGLSLVPDALLEQIANNIVRRRIYEITDAFVQRSIEAFPQIEIAAKRR